MVVLFLVLTIGTLWLNLIGLALAFHTAHRDYAIARVGSLLLFCLGMFFLEHFHGLGPQPPLLLLGLPLTGWLIWKHRAVLRENGEVEAFFAVGFFYALVWRCTFPDIDLGPERLPDLMFLQSYSVGDTLPATDRWLPPFNISFYYNFQHYAAALMGRVLRISPEVAFQFGVCVLYGLAACAAGSAARRFSQWRPAGWLMTAFILIGGNGVNVGMQVLKKEPLAHWQEVRFLGLGVEAKDWTWLGEPLAKVLPLGKPGIELPMETFSFALADGQFHPPQTGIVLLAFTALLIAAQEMGATGRQRFVNHALLAATIPMGLIGNIWIAPLQAMLLGGWLLYRTFRGERMHWVAVLAGGGAALLLAYPHLLEFTRLHGSPAPLRLTLFDRHGEAGELLPGEHSPLGDWLLMFWPVLILLVLSGFGRVRAATAVFLAVGWNTAVVFSEFVFADDFCAGAWNRYNSTLKWWPWIYTGVFLTVGSLNLGSPNRFCRWASFVTIALTLSYGVNLGRHFLGMPKPAVMKLEGSNWIASVPAMKDLIFALSARPDGIALESGDPRSNTEVTALSSFAHKASFLGWPVHEEGLWRGPTPQVSKRQADINLFYKDQLPDPVNWLLGNNIRYILWLQRDQDPAFLTLRDKLRSRYSWHGVFGNDKDWFIGFFELHPELNKPAGK